MCCYTRLLIAFQDNQQISLADSTHFTKVISVGSLHKRVWFLMPVTAPHHDNELKQDTPLHHHDKEEFMTQGSITLLVR